jgi:hypothetical protein
VCKFTSRTICVLAACAAIASAQAQKQYKDANEYPLFDAAIKDLAANDAAKTLADLDTWAQKYPDSDYKDERQILYVKAYAAANQPAKAVDAAVALLSKQLGSGDRLNLLYIIASAIPQIPDPPAPQLEAARKAADELAAWDKIPEGVTAEAWPPIHTQIQTAAHRAQLVVALVPGAQALKKNDCIAAESALKRALEDHPLSAQAAGLLGQAELCLYKTQPDRASLAIYELARAATLDPVQGMVDAKWQQQSVEPALESVYRQYHGDDPEDLKQLKALAVQAPFPPSGFIIKSAAQIEQEKQDRFIKEHPELALWLNLRGALATANGEDYFASDLKDAAVPPLKGVLVEALPACRPNTLMVAVPLPGAQAPSVAEVALKLAKPLTGKPEPGVEFRWEGVATAFTKSPFLLTMETAPEKISGLDVSPCTPPPARTNTKKK